MIDDFTRAIKQDGEAPLAPAIAVELDYLQSLGVNAIELMPWTAWPSDQFSWGYLPYLYFAVAHRYTLDEQDPTKKLVHLNDFIAECHRRQMHVLMDGVFAHVDIAGAGQGFPYYWLYQDPANSRMWTVSEQATTASAPGLSKPLHAGVCSGRLHLLDRELSD